jgi:hypothetical protein
MSQSTSASVISQKVQLVQSKIIQAILPPVFSFENKTQPAAISGPARGILGATGGLTKARLDRPVCALGSGVSSRRLPLVGGLTASGQNTTLSLRKSCAPLIAATEGRKGTPPETTSRRFPPP